MQNDVINDLWEKGTDCGPKILMNNEAVEDQGLINIRLTCAIMTMKRKDHKENLWENCVKVVVGQGDQEITLAVKHIEIETVKEEKANTGESREVGGGLKGYKVFNNLRGRRRFRVL